MYPEKYTYKYPKAGEDNSIVSVHVYDLQKKSTARADIGSEQDIYIPRIQFSNDPNVLCIQRLNRLQNKLEYIFKLDLYLEITSNIIVSNMIMKSHMF